MRFGKWEIFFKTANTMVKKLTTKADIRAEMEAEINRFKKDGGEVTEVPRGLSGRDKTDNSPPPTPGLFLEPTVKRTHVPEVIAAIEARRKEKPNHKANPAPQKKTKRRRKTIYDDFGEPLRTVWVEE